MDIEYMTPIADQEKVMNTKSVLKKLAICAFVFTAYQTAFPEPSVDIDKFQSSALLVAKDDLVSVDLDLSELDKPIRLDFKLAINLDLGKKVNGFVRSLITQ